MSWKYRKRITLLPGFRINLSKSGLSATIGMKGFSVNTGKKGAYLNTGIPGTGIYDRTRLDGPPSNKPGPQSASARNSHVPKENNAVEIRSFQPELITSEGLFGLKESIIKACEIKNELKETSRQAYGKKYASYILLIITRLLVFGFFMKQFKEEYETAKVDAEEAEQAYKNFTLNVDFAMDPSIFNEYVELKSSFEKLMASQMIWDITSTQSLDRVKERSAAGARITRVPVSFSMGSLDYINTKDEALRLHNANGGDLYIYPGFIVMPSKHGKDFAIMDFRDIKFSHCDKKMVEREFVPFDSEIIEYTWRYVNKNGKPDKRFKDNPQIPIVLYYRLSLKTQKGLNESYEFSNVELAKSFCSAFDKYQDSLVKLKWDRES